MTVHQHFTSNQAHLVLFCGFKKGIDRFRMHGTEHQCRGGAIFQQFLHKKCGYLVGIAFIGKLHFGWKGIGI